MAKKEDISKKLSSLSLLGKLAQPNFHDLGVPGLPAGADKQSVSKVEKDVFTAEFTEISEHGNSRKKTRKHTEVFLSSVAGHLWPAQ